MAQAANEHQVDRSVIAKLKRVARDGALAALSASRPGVRAQRRDYELEAAELEVARLSETLKEMAVKLTLAEGKGAWSWVAEFQAVSMRPRNKYYWIW